MPFCWGVGLCWVTLPADFWASFSFTDRGTVGMGGSFSLHDGPSVSVSAFVILRNSTTVTRMWTEKKLKNKLFVLLPTSSGSVLELWNQGVNTFTFRDTVKTLLLMYLQILMCRSNVRSVYFHYGFIISFLGTGDYRTVFKTYNRPRRCINHLFF